MYLKVHCMLPPFKGKGQLLYIFFLNKIEQQLQVIVGTRTSGHIMVSAEQASKS
jgi:hypothetical protein